MPVDDGMDEALQAEDQHWMRRALALAAQAAEGGEVPVGAVVVRHGVEIGAGYNRPITGQDPTAHAEVSALRLAAKHVGNYRLSGATLYVTLEPCTMCTGALVHARVSRLVFGATEPKAGAVVSANRLLENGSFNWRVSVTGGVLAEDCAQMISNFFARRRAERRAARASSGNGAQGNGPGLG